MGIPRIGLLRLIDAAANRASEGLRVVEDYVRFVMDDRHLTSLCKQMRHDLMSALLTIDDRDRLAARETRSDVGTAISTPQETTREALSNVLKANIRRVVESLRSLEEASKLFDSSLAARFESLRYRAYTLERAVAISSNSIARLADARLYVLVDGRESEATFQTMIEAMVDGGAQMIQLRDKRLDDRTFIQRARLLRRSTRESGRLMIINDRPDLAVLSDADGLHIGQDDLSVKEARTIVGPDRLIGVSTHSLSQAEEAVLDGADYLGVGPTFPSETKSFTEFTGLELLRAVSDAIRLPTFAIGGITVDHLDEVLMTGISRVAVSGVITAARDVVERTRELADRLSIPPH